MPVALKKAKPGTPEFRAALRDAMESMGRTPCLAHGVMNWTKDDHWGYTNETGVMLKVVNGECKSSSAGLAGFARSRRELRRAQPRRPDAAQRSASAMDFSIASILLLDGVTNGAVYALLALATVLVFAVTRVIFIPQGEFVAYGALTLAMLQTGKVPGTVWLLLGAGGRRGAARPAARVGAALPRAGVARGPALRTLAVPVVVAAVDELGGAARAAAAACRRCSRWRSSRRSARWSTGWPTSRWPTPACWCC